VRATQAERDREAAMRIAVAESGADRALFRHRRPRRQRDGASDRRRPARLPQALDRDRQALEGVEQTGRTALRRCAASSARCATTATARARAAPRPRELGRSTIRSRRHRCSCTSTAAVLLPRALDLSAYRIVQEGLTNALKHARAGHADVTLRYRPDELQIEVRDDGDGASADDGLGHGLVGVRERVKIYGGDMTAGAATGGGFVLSTRLPVTGYRP
jgi:hypothetical protein